MNTSKAKRRRRRNSLLPVAIMAGVAVILIAAAILILAGGNRADPDEAVPAAYTGTVYTPEMIENAQPQVTPQPTAAMADSRVLSRPIADDGFLPVFRQAQYATEKEICITVDDCYQFKNARAIIDLALEADGRITLFPIGENTLRLQETLTYAFENGMEIENHTFSHNGLYDDSDEKLAEHIYLADAALDSILGVNYQCHFLRPRGGDDRHDQRTHMYIKQLGYYGIAHWNHSGSSEDMESLLSSVEPGNIYLFHTTDNDLQRLQTFIPAVTEMGYKLVTLNEMFGYPDNEATEDDRTEEELKKVPALEPYEEVLIDLKRNDYSYAVQKLQSRLIELGWLTGEADGVYGKGTYNAVGYFQQAAGIKATGSASVETQQILYSEDAPAKK